MRFLIPCLIGLVVLLSGLPSLQAEEKQEVRTVALLPLAVDRAGSFAYLDEAIRQILVTRLFRQDAISVVTPSLSARQADDIRARLQEGRYLETAQRFQADWLAAGAITAVQEGVQVSLVLYPDVDGSSPRQFDFTAPDVDGILPAVTKLAGAVGAHLTVQPEVVVDPKQAVPADDGLAAFQTPHPERDFKKGLYSGATLFGEADDRFQSRGVRRSSPLPIDVETMALGDLDGDGSNDLIVASRGKLRVFRFEEQQFREVAAYDFSPRIKIHVINIGDPGNSGSPKLFVSANDGREPASAILSWDGSSALQPLQQNLDWYIRPLFWPGKGEVLAGQQASPAVSERYLAAGVFELSLDGPSGRLERGGRLPLPMNTNLFDFVVADFNGDGQHETAVIDERQRLLLYDDALSLIWVSGANYGGSLRYFGPSPASDTGDGRPGSDDEQEMRSLVYIPGRLDVKDITGDGRSELVVVTNEVDIVSRYLPNMRSYDGGSVACLGWRGAGLMELWRTNHITGYVADYAFESEAETPSRIGGALNRLYVAQLPDKALWRRFLPGGGNTRILAYEMRVERDR